MFLKRCEMQGFKTFADKIDMEFGPGITAIVGPNGSGKSNITDALRFCLGEGSVRTLRGNRMEEMIFAGSGLRPPSGVAEVTITFDNRDRYFPLEFQEVSITRRLFRGGDNQYFINRAPCRLKDVHQLMAGTGLGLGSICMLGQRELQMVLSPDAQDRKIIIEEAAGIMKYKMRKREAARKLDQVKDNLTRLHDIMREVTAALKAAEAQVERYRRYKRFEQRLRYLEVGIATQEMVVLEQSLADVLQRGAAAAERAAESGERSGHLDELIRSRREEMARQDEAFQALQEERRHAAVELERARNELALCDERGRNLDKDRERIQLRRSRIREQDAELVAVLGEGRLEAERAALQVRSREAAVREQEAALAALEARSVEKSPAWQQARADQQQVARERATLEARREALGEQVRRAAERSQALSGQAERSEQEGSQHGSRHEEKAAEATELRESIARVEEAVTALRTRRSELEARIEGAAREFEKIEDAYHQRSSRLGALMEIEDDYQGFSEGVRFLLKRKDRPAGVIGVVSECIVPEREHARGIEAALGGHAQDVLVEEKRHAKACIELLKRERGGKVTFWPLDLERPPQRRPEVCDMRGVVGWGPELVRYDMRHEGVAMALLGRTVVVENLDVATQIYEVQVRKRAFIHMLVTLDGDILAPGGSMSGGAHRNTKAGPVQRRAELEALEKEVEDLRRRFLQVKEARKKSDEELRTLRAQIEELRNQAQRDTHRLGELDRKASVAQSRAESVATEVARLREEAHAARLEAAGAQREFERLDNALEALARQEATLSAQLAALADEAREQTHEREEAVEVLERLRDQRGEAMRQESEVAQKLRYVAERRTQLEQEERELDAELNGQGGLTGHIERMRMQATADLARYSELDERVGRRYAEALAYRTAATAELEQMEAEHKQVAEAYEADRAELHGCEVARARYQGAFEEHRARLEELEPTPDELEVARQEPIERESGMAELLRTRNYLKNFGTVNLGALEDYEVLKERHDGMQAQVDDLEQASASLLEVMREMDTVSVKQFAETFDRVKSYFATNFEQLFRGGQASLVLNQPDNLLETGVEISAQPPGKRQQNLSLLSSGEKALTAIAFLLAILKSRPSPFVVLDELDAPLDDTNVERVAHKFLEYSEETQFITITHNRKTMEFARVLYGVTMAEPGISRMVAVSLEEAWREAEQPPQELARV